LLQARTGPKKKVGLQQTEAAEVVKVCTQNTDGLALMKEGHSHAVSMPLECIDADITVEQLKGDAGVLEPGEIVLRERLLYFAKQQIPLSSVPRCQDEVKEKCPDGDKPTTVQPAWVQKVEDKIKNGEFPSGAVEDDNDDSDEALIAAQTGVGHRRHYFYAHHRDDNAVQRRRPDTGRKLINASGVCCHRAIHTGMYSQWQPSSDEQPVHVKKKMLSSGGGPRDNAF